jgi:hypothetical protein
MSPPEMEMNRDLGIVKVIGIVAECSSWKVIFRFNLTGMRFLW